MCNYKVLSNCLIFISFFSINILAQEKPEADTIYYEDNQQVCRFESPKGWHFDLSNAQADGYSAAVIPNSDYYYDSDMIIYIWITASTQVTFHEFISSDSIRYKEKYPTLGFIRTDSIPIDTNHYAIYFELDDPGGISEIAFIGYIDSDEVIVVMELNILDRVFYTEGLSGFTETLSGFSIIKKKNEENN